MIKSRYLKIYNYMNLTETISKFGADNDEIFGGRAIADHLLSSPHVEKTTTTFSNPSEHDNDSMPLTVIGINNPTVADMNFRPYKPIWEIRMNCEDYTSEL